MKLSKKKCHHYLISLSTFRGVIVHAYVITTYEEDRDVAVRGAVAELVLNETEKRLGEPLWAPIVLSSSLEASGIAVVEDYLKQGRVEPVDEITTKLKEFYAKKKPGHFLLVFGDTEGASKPLMDLH